MRGRKTFWLAAAFYLLLIALCVAGVLGYRRYTFDKKWRELNVSVRFSVSEEAKEPAITLTVPQLQQTAGRFDEAASAYFYDRISPEEQTVYRGVVYAMEHSLNFFDLPKGTLTAEAITKTVRMACFDHPMLEENCTFKLMTGTLTVGDRVADRYFLCFEGFTAEGLAGKEKAYEAARSVLEQLPAASGREQARGIYDWVVRNIRYTEDENYMDGAPQFLYDAMIGHSSNCDGISNAFALLMNLAGMDCFNVIDEPAEEEDGHTWNYLRWGEGYLSADPTAEGNLFDHVGDNVFAYFGRSQKAMNKKVLYASVADLLPPCADPEADSAGVDVVIAGKTPTAAEKEELQQAIRALKAGASYRLVRCDAFRDLSETERLERIKEWTVPRRIPMTLHTAGEVYCVMRPST